MRISDWSSDVCSSDLYFRNSLGDNLMSITSRILPYKMKIAEQRRAEYRAWHDREFATPLPNDAKRSVLSRYGYPQETWVETGTYLRSEEHTSELQSLMRNSYDVFCMKKKQKQIY